MRVTLIEGEKARGMYFPRSKVLTWYVDEESCMGQTNGMYCKKLSKLEVQVVRQHNIFKTTRVLLHELGHVFISLFLRNKYHEAWDKKKQIEEYKNRSTK